MLRVRGPAYQVSVDAGTLWRDQRPLVAIERCLPPHELQKKHPHARPVKPSATTCFVEPESLCVDVVGRRYTFWRFHPCPVGIVADTHTLNTRVVTIRMISEVSPFGSSPLIGEAREPRSPESSRDLLLCVEAI